MQQCPLKFLGAQRLGKGDLLAHIAEVPLGVTLVEKTYHSTAFQAGMSYFMPEIIFHNVEGVHAMGQSFFLEFHNGLAQLIIQDFIGVYGQDVGVLAQRSCILTLDAVAGETSLIYLASVLAADVRSSVGTAGINDYNFVGDAFK